MPNITRQWSSLIPATAFRRTITFTASYELWPDSPTADTASRPGSQSRSRKWVSRICLRIAYTYRLFRTSLPVTQWTSVGWAYENPTTAWYWSCLTRSASEHAVGFCLMKGEYSDYLDSKDQSTILEQAHLEDMRTSTIPLSKDPIALSFLSSFVWTSPPLHITGHMFRSRPSNSDSFGLNIFSLEFFFLEIFRPFETAHFRYFLDFLRPVE